MLLFQLFCLVSSFSLESVEFSLSNKSLEGVLDFRQPIIDLILEVDCYILTNTANRHFFVLFRAFLFLLLTFDICVFFLIFNVSI